MLSLPRIRKLAVPPLIGAGVVASIATSPVMPPGLRASLEEPPVVELSAEAPARAVEIVARIEATAPLSEGLGTRRLTIEAFLSSDPATSPEDDAPAAPEDAGPDGAPEEGDAGSGGPAPGEDAGTLAPPASDPTVRVAVRRAGADEELKRDVALRDEPALLDVPLFELCDVPCRGEERFVVSFERIDDASATGPILVEWIASASVLYDLEEGERAPAGDSLTLSLAEEAEEDPAGPAEGGEGGDPAGGDGP